MFVKSKLPKISNFFIPALTASVISILLIFFSVAFAVPAKSQESTQQTDSVANAARKARERKANSATHPKLITNADLGLEDPMPSGSTFHLASSSSNSVEAPASAAAGSCDNTGAQQLKRELQDAEHELANLRHELTHRSPVVSDRDLDLQSFRSGNSGLNVGSPPLLDSEPQVPSRVAQVELEERIASLQKALRIACAPPEAAKILIKIDNLEQQLNLSQRQFALDQDAYYSKTDFAKYTAEKAQLDAEQRQIQALQDQIEQLKQELDALKIPLP